MSVMQMIMYALIIYHYSQVFFDIKISYFK